MCKTEGAGGGLILSGEVGKSGRKVCCPFRGSGGSMSREIGMGMREPPGGGSSLRSVAMGDTSGSHRLKAVASVSSVGAWGGGKE